MDEFSKPEKVFINVGPPDNPNAKIIRTERRLGLKDRRRLNTYIAKGSLSTLYKKSCCIRQEQLISSYCELFFFGQICFNY